MDVNIVRSSLPQENILNKVWLHYSAAVSTVPALFGVAIFSKLANPATAGINRNFSFHCSRMGPSQLSEVTIYMTVMTQKMKLKEVESLFQNMYEFIVKMHNLIITKL